MRELIYEKAIYVSSLGPSVWINFTSKIFQNSIFLLYNLKIKKKIQHITNDTQTHTHIYNN